MNPQNEDITLFQALNAGYKRDLGKAERKLAKHGYAVDRELSNERERVVAYNKDKGKILFIENGTDPSSLKDLKTDFGLGLGKLPQDKRIADAKNALVKAKEKYNAVNGTVLVGHSMGGSVVNKIAGGGDKAITYNAGFTAGEKARDNVTHYRTRGDVVSLLAPTTPNTKVLENTNKGTSGVQHLLKTHELANIKSEGIFVDK
jgi:dienelactone hydrolase